MKHAYPFAPKSASALREGDFWPIPLVDGSFACGRVLQFAPQGVPSGRVQFLGALMNWHQKLEPTGESLRGAQTLHQAVMHISAITRVGGHITGNRPLELDGVTPSLFIYGNRIQKGYDDLRAFRISDRANLPVWEWWGWNVIWTKANSHFLGVNLPSDAEPAAFSLA